MDENRTEQNAPAAYHGTRASDGSTYILELLKEANMHIEALSVVRKDNDWDMIAARNARDVIIKAWSNARVSGAERTDNVVVGGKS